MSFHEKLFNFCPDSKIINNINKTPSDPRLPKLFHRKKPPYQTSINDEYKIALEKINNNIIPDNNTNIKLIDHSLQNDNTDHSVIRILPSSSQSIKSIPLHYIPSMRKNDFSQTVIQSTINSEISTSSLNKRINQQDVQNACQKFILPQIPLEQVKEKSTIGRNFLLPQVESSNIYTSTRSSSSFQSNFLPIPNTNQYKKTIKEKQSEVPSQKYDNEDTFDLNRQRKTITELIMQIRKMSKDFEFPKVSFQAIQPLIATRMKNQPIPQIHQINQIQQNKIQPIPQIHQLIQVQLTNSIHSLDRSQPIPQISQLNQDISIHKIQPIPKIFRMERKPIPLIYEVQQQKNQSINEEYSEQQRLKQEINQPQHQRNQQQFQRIIPQPLISMPQIGIQSNSPTQKVNISQQEIIQPKSTHSNQMQYNQPQFNINSAKTEKQEQNKLLKSQDQEKNKLTGRQRSLLNLKNYKGEKIKPKRQPPKRKTIENKDVKAQNSPR